MSPSPLRATAISWVIACGVLYSGAGAWAAAPAAADSGTVRTNHGARGDSSTGNSDSRGGAPKSHSVGGSSADGRGGLGSSPRNRARSAGSGRDSGAVHPIAGGSTTGDQPRGESSGVSARAAAQGPGEGDAAEPTDPGGQDPGDEGSGLPAWPWPWPWPPCVDGCFDGTLGSSREHVEVVPPTGLPSLDVTLGGGEARSSGSGGFVPGEPGQPGEPSVIDAQGGLIGPSTSEPAPIGMPPLIGEAPAFEAPLRAPGTPTGPGSAVNSAPGSRGTPAGEAAAGRERVATSAGEANTEAPVSFRVGYPEYLREAKIGEVAVLALPGAIGIVVLTALGGVVGYRQAKAAQGVRVAGTARFLQ